MGIAEFERHGHGRRSEDVKNSVMSKTAISWAVISFTLTLLLTAVTYIHSQDTKKADSTAETVSALVTANAVNTQRIIRLEQLAEDQKQSADDQKQMMNQILEAVQSTESKKKAHGN